MSNDILAPKKDTKKYVPDPEVVKKVEEILTITRLDLLFEMPFWGQLACRLKLQDASGWCPTAATDGYTLYYNVDFIQKLAGTNEATEELKFLLAHEILHTVYEHFFRRGKRDPEIWNAAADYVINGELVDAKVGKMPSVGLYDEKFKDMTSEEVYDWLDQNVEKIKIPMPMDMHLDVDDGDDDSSGGYSAGDENTPPKIGKGMQDKISDEMKNAIIQAADIVDKDENSTGAGGIPAGLRRLIKQWTEPQIDWTEYVEARITSLIKDDFTFMKPSRRGELSGGILLPGLKNAEKIKVHIAVDNSGSMSNQMVRDVMGEVVGVTEQFGDFEVHVWCFDAAVIEESYKIFTPENISDLHEYETCGGGGTLFEVNYQFMKDREIEPDLFMLFTDGYPCGSWGDKDYCDTLFLVHGDKSIKAPFGVTVHYEKKKKSR